MRVIVYRVYAYDDNKVYLLENEELQGKITTYEGQVEQLQKQLQETKVAQAAFLHACRIGGANPEKDNGPCRGRCCNYSDQSADQNFCWYFMYRKRPMSKPP